MKSMSLLVLGQISKERRRLQGSKFKMKWKEEKKGPEEEEGGNDEE